MYSSSWTDLGSSLWPLAPHLRTWYYVPRFVALKAYLKYRCDSANQRRSQIRSLFAKVSTVTKENECDMDVPLTAWCLRWFKSFSIHMGYPLAMSDIQIHGSIRDLITDINFPYCHHFIPLSSFKFVHQGHWRNFFSIDLRPFTQHRLY